MAIGGTAPINTNIDKNDYMPSIEANGTLVFGPTEAEKQEEAEGFAVRRKQEKRLRRQNGQRKNVSAKNMKKITPNFSITTMI